MSCRYNWTWRSRTPSFSATLSPPSQPSATTGRRWSAVIPYRHNFLTFSYYYSLDHPQSFASIKPIQGGSKPKPVMPPSLPTYQYHIKTGDLRYIFSCQIRKMIFSLIAVNTH